MKSTPYKKLDYSSVKKEFLLVPIGLCCGSAMTRKDDGDYFFQQCNECGKTYHEKRHTITTGIWWW